MTDFHGMSNDDVVEWLKKNFNEQVATKCAGMRHTFDAGSSTCGLYKSIDMMTDI